MVFKGVLRKYQEEALDFIRTRRSTLLSLEMGLGKTVVSLAYCEFVKPNNPSGVLVLALKSTLRQWGREVKKFTDSTVVIVDGSPEQRKKAWETPAYYYIVNYEKLRLSDFPKKWWGVIVADECTKFKNPTAQITQLVWRLQARKKLALSGYPLENHPRDIYSISSFLIPFMFGKYTDFQATYIQTETIHVREREVTVEVGVKNLDLLRAKVLPFMFRKTIEEVKEQIPDITFETLTCEMTLSQEEVYGHLCGAIVCAKEEGESIFNYLTGLLLLSDHPFLLKETEGTSLLPYAAIVRDKESNKLDALMDWLDTNQDDKIVVFSKYVRMLGIIAKELEKKEIKFRFFHGNQSQKENDESIRLFNEDPSSKVLLASDAGAYGLNLQAAHIILNYDLPYNPAKFWQRIGRVRRIGQQYPIVVVNMLTIGTIEERVLEILQEKQSIADVVIDGKEFEGGVITQIVEEIKERTK